MFEFSIDLTCITPLHGGSSAVLGSNSWHLCNEFVTMVIRLPRPPSVSEEAVERMRENFVQSPRTPLRTASCELGMPKTEVWKILRKTLNFNPHHWQLIQVTEDDKYKFVHH
ncbi:hypothetical protein TNCV_4021301 [Trichonephila clavipes]|nr:hypothetical protein TNCV_4021301 [Trichonephila clavipes]